ncbi:MAG: hypothetical protein JSS09_00545, partial [Verrucomicrobia bacterium]|nr:hypothetical protein [Verrucomicrobiota bacterium]
KIKGKIDASNSQDKGGFIQISGNDIFLNGALLDVSGKTGGGTLLIGGDYRGEGPLPHASTVSIDSASILTANATEKGNGGLIVLWSDQRTSFEGTCYAKGGPYAGDGGLVETSSLGEVFISKAYVDTLAPLGNIGSWLLDPALIRITAIGGAIPSGCSNSGDVAVSTIEAQASTVTLCADIILQEVPISMSVSGAGLIFQSPSNSIGALVLQNDITTKGGPIEIQNMETLILGSLTLATTGSGSLGADITLGRMNTDDNLEALTLNAGIGNVFLKTLGDLHPFGTIQVTANQITLNKIFTNSSPITVSGSTLIQGESIISTTASGSGATITLDTVNASSLDVDSLTLDAGSLGSLSIGNVGSSTPLHNFTLVNANIASIQDITSHSGSIDLHSPITLTQPLTTFTIIKGDGFSNIRTVAIEGTISHAESLTFSTNTKDKIFLGELGLTTPLNHVILGSNQSLSVQNVRSTSFKISSQVGTTTLNGDIATTGSEGVLIETGTLVLKGRIETDKLSLTAHGPITAGSSRQDILVRSPGTTFINALNGSLGEQTVPISLTTENLVDPILIGATNLASLAGPSYERKLFAFAPNNSPCIFIFNNHTFLDCNRTIKIIFHQLPRSFFMGANRFNSERLGIGTNLLTQLGPYFLSSYFTDSFLQRIEVPSKPPKAKCEGQRFFIEEKESFEVSDRL